MRWELVYRLLPKKLILIRRVKGVVRLGVEFILEKTSFLPYCLLPTPHSHTITENMQSFVSNSLPTHCEKLSKVTLFSGKTKSPLRTEFQLMVSDVKPKDDI